jgi:hypothetical protein
MKHTAMRGGVMYSPAEVRAVITEKRLTAKVARRYGFVRVGDNYKLRGRKTARSIEA